MKKGDVVEIFEDVFTQEKLEGKAKLIKFVISDPECEVWEVEFLNELGPRYIRTIKETKCLKSA
jgi:hypothetical protein